MGSKSKSLITKIRSIDTLVTTSIYLIYPRMKINTKLLTYVGVVLLTFIVLFVAFKTYYRSNPNVSAPELVYTLKSDKEVVKVGEKISLQVYLTNKEAEKVNAFDIKLYYDPKFFRLEKATPGMFFEKYITIKWDQSQSWFALAQTPDEKGQRQITNTNSPVINLELVATDKTESTQISTGASTVYLTQMGGFHPQMGTMNLKIE